jgi:hypothetical protein
LEGFGTKNDSGGRFSRRKWRLTHGTQSVWLNPDADRHRVPGIVGFRLPFGTWETPGFATPEGHADPGHAWPALRDAQVLGVTMRIGDNDFSM